MLKRIFTILSILIFLGCSKSAQDNKLLIGDPWTFTYFSGPIPDGTVMSLTFFKTKNTQGAATFTQVSTYSGAVHKHTATYRYGVANNGTEIKFTPEDSSHVVLGKGSGLWSIDDISSNSLKLTFEDDTTHTTHVELVR